MALSNRCHFSRFFLLLIVVQMLFIPGIPTAFASDLSWSQKAPMPTATSRASRVVVDGKLYLLGGETASGLSSAVLAYDAASDSWETRPSLSGPRFVTAEAAVGNVIYLFGGADHYPPAPKGNISSYETGTGNYQDNAGTLQVPRFRAAAAYCQGMVYVFGGMGTGGTLDSYEMFDPNTGQSYQMGAMPEPRENMSVVELNGFIYLIGGNDATGSPTTTCWKFDPAYNTFTACASMPAPAQAGKAAVTANGMVYLAGGVTSTGYPPSAWTTEVRCYNPATNVWSSCGNFPTPRYATAAGVINGVLYIAGGDDSSAAPHPLDVTEAAPLAGLLPEGWLAKASMPDGVSRALSAVSGGSIYVLGGAPATANVRKYNPNSDTWSAMPPLPAPLFGGAAAEQMGTVYLAGGFDEVMNLMGDVAAYNTADGSYTPLGSLIEPRARFSGAILNNKFYLVGGDGFSSRLDSIEAFDLATNTSSIVARLPEPTSQAGVVAVGNKLYILSGGSNNNRCWRFDPYTGQLTSLTDFPLANTSLRTVQHRSGRIYAVASWSVGGQNTLLEYNIAADTWNNPSYVPSERNVPTVELVDDMLYVIGADFAGETKNEAYRLPADAFHIMSTGIAETNPEHVPTGSTIDWSPTERDLVAGGAYIEVGGRYYIVGGSGVGSWNDPAFNSAVLLEVDQVTKAPLLDGMGQLVFADLRGKEGLQAVVHDFAPVPGYLTVNVYLSGSGSGMVADSNDPSRLFGRTTRLLPFGSTLSLTAAPAADSSFAGWTGCSSAAGVVCSQAITWPLSLEASFGSGTFTPAEALDQPRMDHGSVALLDGRVMVLFGNDGFGSILPTTLIYDPAAGTWSAAATASTARYGSTATLLADGRILVAGGENTDGSTPAFSEIYDPASDSWSVAGAPNTARTHHSAVRLADGRVLVAGGYLSGSAIAGVEIYDPSSGSFYPASDMLQARVFHAATLLLDGRVLVSGGTPSDQAGNPLLPSAEIYDPATGTWSPAGNMLVPRTQHLATLLNDGRVLVTGGIGGGTQLVQQAEIFDPLAGWSVVGFLTVGRVDHTATLLGDGRVLVAGGENPFNALHFSSTEIFDPQLNRFELGAPLSVARANQSATLLGNGQVLIAGGCSNDAGRLSSTELYTPQGVVPGGPVTLALTVEGSGDVQSAPAGLQCYGGTCYAEFPRGNAVKLVAAEPPGHVFTGWSGCDAVSANTCTLNMDGNSAVTARYEVGPARFLPGPGLHTPFNLHAATLLQNGKVLLTGGSSPRSAQLYDPEQNSWSDADHLFEFRAQHTQTLLNNGKVLVTGGEWNIYTGAYAELYDPVFNTFHWTSFNVNPKPRNGHTAVLLKDGRVLVAGGLNWLSHFADAEIYQPVDNAWFGAASMQGVRYYHTASLLPDGRVMVAGGAAADGSSLASVEIYDPAADSWTPGPSLAVARRGHTATTLADGKVLVTGGFNATGPVSAAELYDPVGDAWSPAGDLFTARTGHTASLLPSGKVLVAGGTDDSAVHFSSAELYDPETNIWSEAAPMYDMRSGHTAVLLQNGRVLLAGGGNNDQALSTVELYGPGDMPSDGEAPASTIVSPVPGPSDLTEIYGTADDGTGSGVWRVDVSVDAGASWYPASGTLSWRYERGYLPNGQYTVMSRATDYAGNVEVPAAGVQVTVSVPVSIRILAPAPGGSVPGGPVTVTGTASTHWPIDRIEVTTDGGATWSAANGWDAWSYALPSQPDGAYTVQARVLDVAGNTALSAPVSFRVDTLGPSLNIEVSSDTMGANGWHVFAPTVTLTPSDDQAGAYCEYRLDGDQTWTRYYAPFKLYDGVHTVTVRARDAAGNLSTEPVLQVKVDQEFSDAWWSRGPFGANVKSVAVSPAFATDRTVFIGTTFSGLLRSRDAGLTWEKLAIPVSSSGDVYAVALSPEFATDRTMFAGTSSGVFRSSDAGATWSQSAGVTYTDAGSVMAIKVSPEYRHDGLVLVGSTGSSLYRSVDWGRTFTKITVNSTYDALRSLAFSPGFYSDRTVYAGSYNGRGVFRSTDGGESWSACASLAGGNTVYDLDTAATGIVVVNAAGGVFRSNDRCDSWSLVNATGGDVALAPNFYAEPTIYAGTNRSTDGGATWAATGSGGGTIAFSPDYNADGVIFSGTYQGMMTSSDRGLSWSAANDGIVGRNVSSFAFSPNFTEDTTVFTGLNSGGVYKCTEGGVNWQPVNSGITDTAISSVAVSPAYPTDRTVFAASKYGRLFRSTDAGSNWSTVNTVSSRYGCQVGVSPAFATDRTVIAGFDETDTSNHYGAIKRSVDGGTTWTTVKSYGSSAGAFTATAFSPAFATDRTVFLGSERTVAVSRDGGSTWSFSYPGSTGVYGLAISPVFGNDGTVFAAGPLGVYRSTDGGITWSLSSSGFPIVEATGNPIAARAISVSPLFASDRTLFAATDSGVFMSRDGGDSWRVYNEGLQVSRLRAIAVAPNWAITRRVYVGGYYGSVWSRFFFASPYTEIHNPGDGGMLVSRNLSITGIAADGAGLSGLDYVEVSTDSGSSWQRALGLSDWSLAVTLPADGSYQIMSRAHDLAGNTGQAATASVIVDTTVPVVNIVSPPAGLVGTGAPQLSYTASEGVVAVSLDGAAIANTSGSNLGPLADGEHTLVVEAWDEAGNYGRSEVRFRVDTVAPTSSVSTPITGSSVPMTFAVTGTADDGAGGGVKFVDVTTDGGATFTRATGTASWSCQVTVGQTGQYLVQSRATDNAGNAGSVDAGVTVNVGSSLPLQLTVAGNGEVHSTPAPDLNCPGGSCTEWYGQGTNLVLTAVPAPGYLLDYWSGCDQYDGNSCSLLMQGPASVHAQFVPIGQGAPWAVRAPMPVPVPVARAASGTVNGKIYLFGGNASDGSTANNIQVYQPLSDSWQELPPMPVRLLGAASATAGEYIYLAGGELEGGVYSDAVYRYHAPSGTFEQIGALSAPRFRLNGAILDGVMYLFGGIGQGGVLDTVEAINLSTGQSTLKTVLPQPATLMGAETVGDRIYLFGGSGANGNVYSETYAYDPVTNGYEQKANMPEGTEIRSCATDDGRIYVVGGMNMGQLSSKVQLFEAAAGTWSVTGDLTSSRFGTAVHALDGTMYVMGGFNWQNPALATNEALAVDVPWRVHNVGPPRVPASDPKFVVDWMSTSHAPVLPGEYLKVGSAFYRVLGGGAGTWDGAGYTAAALARCDQQTGETLYDSYGNMILPDMRGSEGASLIAYASWPVPEWKVNSSGPAAGNQWGLWEHTGIDWDQAAHGAIATGSYLKINGTYYRAVAAPESPISSGSWSGAGFNAALLQQCDQATGVPVTADGNPVYTNTSGLTGAFIHHFASWPLPADATAPVTNARIDCPRGADGSCTSNATITLEAADSGSGILYTEYRVGEVAAWANYTGPFTLTTQGTSRIYFRSVDIDGNREDAKQVEVTVKIPFWQSSGPYGGNIREIVFSGRFATDRTVFSSGFYAGIYRSVDGGVNWAAVSSELSGKFINAIAVSPRYDWDHTIFAGTTDGGVYRSLDAGTTWTLLATGIPVGSQIYDIQVSPDYANDGTVFVSAYQNSGVYRSTDRGESWQQMDFGGVLTYIGALALSPNFAADRTLYAGDTWGRGLRRSTDAGATWNTCSYFDGLNGYINNVMVADDGTVFATNSTQYTYRSTDGCQSWSFAVENLTNSLSVSPDFANDRTVFAGSSRSTDGGVTWTRVVPGYVNVFAVSPSFASDGVVLSGTDVAGISRSVDRGATWVSSTAGLLGLNVVQVVASPGFASDNTLFAAADSAGVYRSTDGGATWSLSNTGITETGIVSISVSPAFGTDRTVFAASRWKLYRSTDGGVTWSAVKTTSAEDVKAVAVSPNFASDRTVLLFLMSNSVGFDHYVYRSTDGGTTWVKGKTLYGSTDPLQVAFSPSFASDGTVFVTTVSMLYRSTDSGLNWTAFSPAANINSVAVSPDFTTDRKVYIGTWNGLYRSTDGGSTWSRMGNAGLPLRSNGYPVLLYTLSVTGGAGDRLIFAGTDSGVFQSADEGNTWSEANVGLSGVKVRNLTLSPNYLNDRRIFGGGYYGSVWTGAPAAFDAPVASFTGTPLSGFAPLLVTLSDTSLNTPTGWSWEFGDGGRTNVRNPLHAFSNPGVYRVKLTVTNPSGTDIREIYDYVSVQACPNDPVRVGSGGLSFDSMQDAFNTAASGDTIFAQAKQFTGDVVLSRDVSVVLKGGYDCGYTTNPVAATMDGTLRVTAGTLQVENLVFR